MDLRLVEAQAVAEAAVFAELFAVVGGEDQQGLIEDVPPPQLVDQPPSSRSSDAMQSS